ncbi:hypothetical protein [Paraburkholderia saeva]|jgi:hypothetical protein|uniref:Uncharacterized protein n=1 Tax=Paraburkholderia saeva TaxID=2777537 RepID=A0A9N8S0X2_9BURK|nr:hypothetical protein [Paraburkholderia saeva]CAG4904706.1 hypothetical protein R52603_03238 [Paraburkholderia saeva]CAG4915738.1 hypothetical protein LMG31841_04511 [Paraburkholderia saeva]
MEAANKRGADAAKTVFVEVEHHWRSSRAGGKALYGAFYQALLA